MIHGLRLASSEDATVLKKLGFGGQNPKFSPKFSVITNIAI
jgi:hypothetical protein